MATEQDASAYPRDPKTDTQGRIIDPQTGRVLRDRRSRTSHGAFRGKSGREHPRQKHLNARIKDFESMSNQVGHKRPGSLSK